MMAWIMAHWPVLAPVATLLALSIVSTLANHLTAYPEVETMLHALQDLLAARQRTDSPGGGWKLPGTRSKVPEGKVPYRFGRPSGTAVLALVFMACTQIGCCVLSHSCRKEAQGFFDCEKTDVKTHVANLKPTIGTLLAHADDWQLELEKLGYELGEEVIACAVQAAAAEREAVLSSTGTKPQAAPGRLLVRQRAAVYLAGKKFKPPAAEGKAR